MPRKRSIGISRKKLSLRRTHSFRTKPSKSRKGAYTQIKRYFEKNFPDKKVRAASKQGRKNLYVGEIRFFKGIAREEGGLFFGKNGILGKRARSRHYYD